MEPRRPKSPVSLFYVSPEPRPKTGGRTQEGGSVFTGSSRGSSTIKASRSNLFRFSKPKAGDDSQKKKSSNPKDLKDVASSGRSSDRGNVSQEFAASMTAENKAKAKERKPTADSSTPTGYVTGGLTPAAEYLLLQQGNIRADPPPPHMSAPGSSSSPDPRLATVSSLALQDLMSPRNLRTGGDIHAPVSGPIHDSDDHRFIQELEAAAVDAIPTWLILDGDNASRSAGRPRSQGNVSPVASSYLSVASEFEDEDPQDRLLSKSGTWSGEDGGDSSESDQDEVGDGKSYKSMHSHDQHVGTHRRSRESNSIKSATRSQRPPKPMRPPPTLPYLASRPDGSPSDAFRQEAFSPVGLDPHGGLRSRSSPVASPVSASFPHRPGKAFPDGQSELPPFTTDGVPGQRVSSSPRIHPTPLRGEDVYRTELGKRMERLEKEARERERKLSDLVHRLNLEDD